MTDLAQQSPRLFLLVRDDDETGVSGEGVVAKGVEFTSGLCLMQWIVPPAQSIVVHQSMEKLVLVHGHNGKTRVEYVQNSTVEAEQLESIEETVYALVSGVTKLALSA